jgi:hypothetical protein
LLKLEKISVHNNLETGKKLSVATRLAWTKILVATRFAWPKISVENRLVAELQLDKIPVAI